MVRFDYSVHSTMERAERALEDYFSTGEVSWGDQPKIEMRIRKTASWSKAKPLYAITVNGT